MAIDIRHQLLACLLFCWITIPVTSEDLSGYFNSSDYDYASDANGLNAESEIGRLQQEYAELSPYKDCPFHDDDPCECSIITFDTGRNISIVCRDFQDRNILPIMMDKLRMANYTNDLRTLFLYRCNLSLPHSGLFDNLPFTGIQIHEVNISVVLPSEQDSRSPDIYRPLLDGLELSLEVVDFAWTQLPGTELQGCSLGALPKLRRFSLTESNVTEIPKEFFCCSYMSTEEVYLFGNEFEVLQDGAMSRAKRLRIAQLNRNRIFLVSRNFFPYPAMELQEIHLRGNNIATLPMDMFSFMPALTYVDISQNKVQHLPMVLWEPIWKNLFDIYLDDNAIICDCTIKWLAAEERHNLSPEFKQQRFFLGTCYDEVNRTEETSLADLDELLLPECMHYANSNNINS